MKTHSLKLPRANPYNASESAVWVSKEEIAMLTQKTPTTLHLLHFVYNIAIASSMALNPGVIAHSILRPLVVGLQKANESSPTIASTLHVLSVPWSESSVGISI